jgi:hypothetical protein
MRDDAASEEALLRELDSMYQRVADLETKEPVSQKKEHALKDDALKVKDKTAQGNVIQFPEKKINVPHTFNQETGDVPEIKPLRKSPYFKYIVVIFISVFFWACIFWISSFYKSYSSLSDPPVQTRSGHIPSNETTKKTLVPALIPAADNPQK